MDGSKEGAMADSYDVIVAGAGPGGAAAAYFLGESGRRVLVLEKERLPRYKACGGGLSAALLAQFPFSFEPVYESRVTAFAYCLRGEAVVIPLPESPMRMVMRAEFDSFLLAHARAEVRPGCAVRSVRETADRVEVTTAGGETFTAPFLIGADGANSAVARSLGWRRGKAPGAALEAEVAVPADVYARFAARPTLFFGDVRLGYLWVFPKRNHLSVGIGALLPKPGLLQQKLRAVMAREGIDLRGAPLHGHPLPFNWRPSRVASRRILLAGDAAGLTDPLSGEGIRQAITSGRLAAEMILAGRPQDYAALVERRVGSARWPSLALAGLFYLLPDFCFALGACNPIATRAFTDLLAERIGSVELLVRLFGTLPLFLVTETAAIVADLFGGNEQAERIRRLLYSGEGE
jgi:geranylgeranyl reductase family protein